MGLRFRTIFRPLSHLHKLSRWIYRSWNYHTRRICQNKSHLYYPSSYKHTVRRHTLRCYYRFPNCSPSCSKHPCLHCSLHLCYTRNVYRHVPRCTWRKSPKFQSNQIKIIKKNKSYCEKDWERKQDYEQYLQNTMILHGSVHTTRHRRVQKCSYVHAHTHMRPSSYAIYARA